MTQKRPPSQDDVVTAVLSGAPTVRRLVKRFTEEIGDPLDDEGIELPEVDSGGFVWFHELDLYEDVYDLFLLEGKVSARRLDALAANAAPTQAELLIYARRTLAAYFAEPVEGAAYVICAVVSSNGRKAYWAEVRDCVQREGFGIVPIGEDGQDGLTLQGLAECPIVPAGPPERRPK